MISWFYLNNKPIKKILKQFYSKNKISNVSTLSRAERKRKHKLYNQISLPGRFSLLRGAVQISVKESSCVFFVFTARSHLVF